MGNMRFKVGDRVRIKSLDWYNRYTNGTEVDCGAYPFTSDMKEFCGQEKIIAIVCQECYFLLGIDDKFVWTDEMIEGLVEEETKFGTASKPIEIKSNANCLTRERVDELATKIDKELPSGNQNVWELPDGYQFTDENGNVINATKIVLEKKKKEYPKTYEECCKVLQYGEILKIYPPSNADVPEYDVLGLFDLLETLRKLLICRETYWKIAGEEMGLGKPWMPDWKNDEQFKYIIICRRGCIIKDTYTAKDVILAFPTEEMRDAFKENFDKDLEFCKELL